ncbi:hypothetical protein TNCV_4069241 [Trichonephila clavipes]|nr:hypothetical protein TNCV_4069241 [Trichonephila clavipes]
MMVNEEKIKRFEADDYGNNHPQDSSSLRELSEFERGRIIGLKEGDRTNRKIARHKGQSDAAIRICWQGWVDNGSRLPRAKAGIADDVARYNWSKSGKKYRRRPSGCTYHSIKVPYQSITLVWQLAFNLELGQLLIDLVTF